MSYVTPVKRALSGPRSEFRRVVAGATLDEHSAHHVEHLVQQTKLATPNVNIARYNLPIYQVDDAQLRVDVMRPGFTALQMTYSGLAGDERTGPFRGVPIPDEAVGAIGSDGALAIVHERTGQLWEFWQAKRIGPGQWTAQWGGYVPSIDEHAGIYERGLGVSASGLVNASGVITLDEALTQRIDHALGLAVPHVVGKDWSYPASRCDGSGTSTAPFALHEGRRFRLRADVDVDALVGPPDWRGVRRPLHPITRAIARACQQYGFVIVDRAGCVTFSTESGAPFKARTGIDPWAQLLRGTPEYRLLEGFPWELCEALPFNYGRGLVLGA